MTTEAEPCGPKKPPGAEETEAFHAHLDICEQCREDVFNLCPVGKPLLLAAGAAALPGKMP